MNVNYSQDFNTDLIFSGSEDELKMANMPTNSGDLALTETFEQELLAAFELDNASEPRITHETRRSDFDLNRPISEDDFLDIKALMTDDKDLQDPFLTNDTHSMLEFAPSYIAQVSPDNSPDVSDVDSWAQSDEESILSSSSSRNDLLTLQQQEAVAVTSPQTTDILFGRGKNNREHPGNQRMKVHIEHHRTAYNRAGRRAKTEITRQIVKTLQSEGARFLKQTKTSHWEEVSDDVAREKVGHAMRDGRRNMAKQQQQQQRTRSS